MKPKTYMQKSAEIKRNWRLVDVGGKLLGESAGKIAALLIGKDKPTYTPHVDAGDYVVVINAKDVAVTGKKAEKKLYYNHSGYPGGMRIETFNEVIEKNPARVIEHAVKGMLPKNKLQALRMKRLRVFAQAEHTYTDEFGK